MLVEDGLGGFGWIGAVGLAGMSAHHAFRLYFELYYCVLGIDLG
jgi:hypothetical protein